MELDELKQVWREQSQRLDNVLDVNVHLLKTLETERSRSALRSWGRLPTYELVSGIVAQLWLVHFVATHLGMPNQVLSGVILAVAALLAVIVSAMQLVMVARVDYAAPVVEIQERLGRLRTLRLRNVQWTLLLAPLLWTPLSLVLAQAVVGVDLYRAFGPAWVWVNLAFGVAVIPVAVWMSRLAGARWGGRPFWKRLRDDVTGRGLVVARAAMDELVAFRREA
jgi:hypothetical protein